MNLNSHQPMHIRERATNGPVPRFDTSSGIAHPDRHEPIAPGDVLEHGEHLLIVTSVDDAVPVGRSTVTLFNQQTRQTRTIPTDELVEIDQNPLANTTLHAGVLIPADGAVSLARAVSKSIRPATL